MAEGEDEGAAVALTRRDTEVRGVSELVALTQRVVLRVSVPEELVLRERVPEAVAEAHFDVVAEVQGLCEKLGEGVWLALPLGLAEPLELSEVLADADKLGTVGVAAADCVEEVEGEGVTEAVPFAGEAEVVTVTERLREVVPVTEFDTDVLRVREPHGEAEEEPEKVAQEAAPSIMETEPPSARVQALGGAAVQAAKALPAQLGSENADMS